MEIRVILRGALAGFVAGVLGFGFARIFAEPYIEKAIDYEAGRDDAITAIDSVRGVPVSLEGPELFSRTVQSTVGMASGIIAFSTAMGALVAVTYLILHGRFGVRPRTLGLFITGFGFLGVFMLPFVKYPANPPAIGHSFTIATRAHLYLTMVSASLVLLGLAVYLGRRLRTRFGVYYASLISAGAFLVLFSALLAVLPSVGHLHANVVQSGATGYARAATETPQPITNPAGQLVYPGFDADVLWKFRFYSVINQLIIWVVIGLAFSGLLERVVGRAPNPNLAARETVSL